MFSHVPEGSDLDPQDVHGTTARAAGPDRRDPAFGLAPVGIDVVDLDGRTTWTNDVLRQALGYSVRDFASMPFSAFTHPDDVEANLDRFALMVDGKIDHFAMEKRFIRKDGGTLSASLTMSLVAGVDGGPGYAIGVTHDITERRLSDSDPRGLEQRSELQVERVPAIVYVAEPGPNGRWLYVSPQIESILGFSAQEWMADPGLWLKQLHPQDREGVVAREERLLVASPAEEGITSQTYRLRHRSGATVWVRDDSKALWDQDGCATMHGVLVNVTREKQLEERLEHQAHHDPLTGLANRKLFHDRVGHALAGRGTARVAVLFIDLDNFKTVNDSFGHACGDEVIVAVAHRLEGCGRAGDIPARLGGDEFAVLMPRRTRRARPGPTGPQLAATLRTVIGRPLLVATTQVVVGVSIGHVALTELSQPGDVSIELLRRADLALYRAKDHRSGCVTWNAQLDQGSRDRLALLSELRSALQADDQIEAWYQPKTDPRDGRVLGFEALVRWNHPTRGLLLPGEFLAAVERAGLLPSMTARVLAQAVAFLAELLAADRDVHVAVNLGAPDLLDVDLPASVARVLAEHAVPARHLRIEVTETVVMSDPDRILATLVALRTLGVGLSLDDYGTGLSSLAYLRVLPVDELKIDRSFVRDLLTDSSCALIVSSTVRLAHDLRLRVVAEGVEDQPTLEALAVAGCDTVQGWHTGRPMSAAAIRATLPMRAPCQRTSGNGVGLLAQVRT